MVCRWTLVVAIILFYICISVDGAAASPYQWKTTKDSVCLMAGGKVVYCCHFAKDEGYPYIHPLSLPGGPVISAFAPADHLWHRGLWFSWKYLNGVNYWEFPKDRPNQPDGKTTVVATTTEMTDSVATVRLKLEYSAKDQVVLTEARQLRFSTPRADGSYTIDWKATFAAKSQDVVLDRTPPEKAPWGGYGGLGFRAATTMREFRAIDSEGRVGRQQAHGKQARWMDFSGVFGEKDEPPVPGGVAIFDHPANPRHPTPWYLSDNAGMPYFGPALLFAEPMLLKAGESITLKYRILVHTGLGDRADLEKQFQAFAKTP